MKLLRFIWSTSPLMCIASGLTGLLASGASIFLLRSVQVFLSGMGSDSANAVVVWPLVGVCFLLPATKLLSCYLLVRHSQGALFELRLRLSRQIALQPLDRLERQGPARFLAVLIGDVNVITAALEQIPGLLINLITVVACLAYLAWLSTDLFLGLLVLLAIGVVSYQVPQWIAYRYLRRTVDARNQLFRRFRELMDGMKELKLHQGRKEAFFAGIEEIAHRIRGLTIRATSLYGAAAGWGEMLLFAVLLGLLLGVTTFTQAAPEVLLGYCLVLLYLMNPLQALMNTMPLLARANVSVANIEELDLSLAGSTAARLPLSGAEPVRAGEQVQARSLALDGVTYRYAAPGGAPEDGFHLGPIDLHLEPGESIFLTGGNGCGKTTLAKLLCGLYAPTTGSIRYGGMPVTDESRGTFRELFSAIFSDFFLFDALLGLGGGDLDERAGSYLESLHLTGKVAVEGGGGSTTDLSQGQRKRLALLTAYLEDRPVYLFDEWAADQDPVFKDVFYRHLLPDLTARGKMVLVISHDAHYYDSADRLIRLRDGRVEEDSRKGEGSRAVSFNPAALGAEA